METIEKLIKEIQEIQMYRKCRNCDGEGAAPNEQQSMIATHCICNGTEVELTEQGKKLLTLKRLLNQ